MIRLYTTEIGSAQVLENGGEYTLKLIEYNPEEPIYSDAQITSYKNRSELQLGPPLRMDITARFEGDLEGTAGFGFWNQPFMPGQWMIWPPRAVWFFFGSKRNNIHLARDVSGNGWKSGTIDASRWQFWALLPTAPVGFFLMRIPALYRLLWPIAQDALGVSEKRLDSDLLGAWHTYSIIWNNNGVQFLIDNELVHRAKHAPSGKLGFIAWVDNQYAIVTPQGQFGGGLVKNIGDQALLIRNLSISRV